MNIQTIEDAREYEPEGTFCGFCGKVNDNFDDLGFFYMIPLERNSYKEYLEYPSRPVCQKCSEGEVGEHHRKICGVGER